MGMTLTSQTQAVNEEENGFAANSVSSSSDDGDFYAADGYDAHKNYDSYESYYDYDRSNVWAAKSNKGGNNKNNDNDKRSSDGKNRNNQNNKNKNSKKFAAVIIQG